MLFSKKIRKFKYIYYCPHCKQIALRCDLLVQEISEPCPKCGKFIDRFPLERIREDKSK